MRLRYSGTPSNTKPIFTSTSSFSLIVLRVFLSPSGLGLGLRVEGTCLLLRRYTRPWREMAGVGQNIWSDVFPVHLWNNQQGHYFAGGIKVHFE